MKKGKKESIASQTAISHRLLIGPPLLLITIFAYGFVIMHNHTAAELSSTTKPKPAPSAIQPSGGLTIIQPTLTTLSPAPGGTPSGNPEGTVTPQLPGVASTRIQAAQQRREATPNSDNAAVQARLKEANGILNR